MTTLTCDECHAATPSPLRDPVLAIALVVLTALLLERVDRHYGTDAPATASAPLAAIDWRGNSGGLR